MLLKMLLIWKKLWLLGLVLVNIGRCKGDITISCDAVCNQVEAMHGEEENECDMKCRREQCQIGCLDWREGTRTSCQQTCTLHGWQTEDTMFCTMGCVYSAQTYLRQAEDLIGKPTPPMLVGGSVSGSSVGLRWEPAAGLGDVSYLVQYHQNNQPGEWKYYMPSNPINDTEIMVEDLKPYTKYQFRIAWLVLPRHGPIMSEASSWISTLASGPPRSPPRELKAVPLDWSRVEVKWDPPLFPGGDLISYTLYSKDTEGLQEMRANIEVGSERRYILSELLANTTYVLNLTSTNHRGEGPGVTVQVTTYPSSQASLIKKPGYLTAVNDGEGYLLVTSGASLLKLGLDIVASPQHIFNTSGGYNITGLAVHIHYGLVYISDSSGSIYQLRPYSQPYTLLTRNHIHGFPLSLSVDWLYGYLYYVVHLEPPMNHTWQLWRCDLLGKHPVMIHGELNYEAKHLQVDPYNGYIWWISEESDGGLYRLTMTNEESPTAKPQLVLKSPNLGGLVLDPPNFQVLVADKKNNTMLAVSLDGTSVTDLRPNTQQAYFKQLRSVVHLNSRFFWTDGNEIFTEELNKGTFYHNSYYLVSRVSVGTLVAVHGSTQPFPVPLNPPSDLQAVFTRTSASLRWNSPSLPALMGAGAWQKWTYELHIQEGKKIMYNKNISDTTYQAKNLRPGTFYVIKVQAKSLGGNGPWSREFRGRTLDASDAEPQLVWAIDHEILITNLVGSESKVLVSQETLQNKLKDGRIADLAFFRDLLVLAVNNQSVYLLNTTSLRFTEVPNTHGVLSVSVEWITQRLFWANPHRQMIGWTSLDGLSQGPLNVVTAAREVRVDALHGRLFWTTPHALLMSTLAGRNITTVHQEGIFSGKQVYGLTVDTRGSRIWWIVRDADGCRLLGAYLDDEVEKFDAKLLPHTVKLGPMWYLSERLFWLGEDGDVVVADTSLNNSASLLTSNLGVTHFTVMLQDLQPMPDGVRIPVVIPDPIDAASVMIKGTWENFELEWSSINNVNYGNLTYEVIIDNGVHKKAILTQNRSISYDEELPPYSTLKVSVRGITDWSVGNKLIKVLKTPPSIPEAPEDLRTFVQKVQDSHATIHLRWSPPEKPNGRILQYEVIYCLSEEESNCKSEYVSGQENQLQIENLSSDHVYRFKVAALSEVGKGPFSLEVTEAVQKHMPTPSLLVLSSETLMKLDADLQEESELLSESSRVQWVTPLLKNSSFAWMDGNSDIFLTDLRTNFTERLLRLTGHGVGMAADWVGEMIVWAERPSQGSTEVNIWSFEIGHREKREIVRLSLADQIKKFLLSPMTSHLFLLHEGLRGLQLSVMSLGTRTLKDVFNQERTQECNCLKTPAFAGGVALDTTNTSDTALYFVAAGSSTSASRSTAVYKSDLSGCFCEEVFVPEDFGYGTCSEIAVDFSHLYCYAPANQTLLWFSKSGILSSEELHFQTLYNTSALIPLDLATQPMPDSSCLVASNYSGTPKSVGIREYAIAVELTVPEASSEECSSMTLPPVIYVVYYAPVTPSENGSCNTDVLFCQQVRSAKSIVNVVGLQPFTRYYFRAAVETVYNQRLGISSQPGPSAIFKTKAKAPDSVGEVIVEAVSPEEIDVKFSAVADQEYEIHWEGEASSGPLRPQVNISGEVKQTISKLLPNTKYEVWVRVYSRDRLLFTDSQHVTVITLPELPPIKLENTTARSLYISWTAPSDDSVLRHAVQYIPYGETVWENTPMEQTSAGQIYARNITHLQPATSYLFRIRVIYDSSNYHEYIWPRKPLFNFTTLGEIPGRPGQVMRQQVGGISISGGLRVWWKEAEANGAPIVVYTLQAAPYVSSDDLDYVSVYNGSNNYWLINNLDGASSYFFRARAINELGAGPWGEKNVIDTIVGPTMLTQRDLPTILASTIPTALLAFGTLFACATFFFRKTNMRRKKVKAASLNDSNHHHHRNREVELATLRQLPTNNNFVTENNVLYNLHAFPGDDLDLPHVSRHCITLTKFLGSGAFGEVFEGTACEIPGWPDVTKVAIKTLRKGATEMEKAEFLKEAQLMSHFQHEHILRLLAVCTDHDPFFLILELMEGGDLLSYLRTSRGGAENGLTLADLVAMCVDVAKGCVYLEEMHYVHRDLAARNCLVTTTDPALRVVKIGDFGLARDIYKNDYYRKEGEGLLPVRWMSPESLVDGVFTSHSDVWAFGVLLWEILTLGQQPYPARTNLEVLHYVRSGGRLTRPPNCPEELHKLMDRCWSYSPENRPTFKECLNALVMLDETISSLPALAVHNVHYIGSNGTYGLDNLAYAGERDENHNTNSGGNPQGNSLVSAHDCSSDSWSAQNSGSVVNLGRRRGGSHEEDLGTEVEVEESDSFSGASTLPLTAPLRRHQQYLQLVNEPSPSSPPVSPRSPPACCPLTSETSSDWSRYPNVTANGEIPQSPANLITEAQISVPSTPLSISMASPVPDSPTSVTFTFPTLPSLMSPTLPSIMSPEHYLKPCNNKAFAGNSSETGCNGNDEHISDDDECEDNQITFDNSYVNMSAGADIKCAPEVSSPLDLEKLNGVSLRCKKDCDILADLENHRLSGVSALSAVSGMTSASTVDLEHNPSQSWC